MEHIEADHEELCSGLDGKVVEGIAEMDGIP